MKKSDYYIKELEERVSILETRLTNYDFFIVTSFSAERLGDLNYMIRLGGIGEECLVISLDLVAIDKILRMPFDDFIELISSETGCSLQFFHGSKTDIVLTWTHYRSVQFGEDMNLDGVDRFFSSGGRVVIRDVTFYGR